MADHIHTREDGRGRRYFLLNGKRLERCFYADTKRGIADVYSTDKDGAVKIDKHRKRALSKRLRGTIEVVFYD
ncbi:MAG: hypothetical protein ACTIJ4_01570 [Halomonas sp.]